MGFLQESLRWWDHWLKGIDMGILQEPMLRVWMPEAITPQPYEAEWPGRWVAEPAWPPAHNTLEDYFLGDGELRKTAGPTSELSLLGSQINGGTAGVWCPYGNKFGLPIDQRLDDALSLCFTSAPLDESEEILGFPEVRLSLCVDQPEALLAVRLCDVAPDGASRLVSWGLLNLTHRAGHEQPQPLQPGEVYDVAVQLNAVAHRLLPGHRWRVAISPTYWPHAWPSPQAVRLTVFTGEGSKLTLPVRPTGGTRPLDETLIPFEAPEGALMLEFESLRPEDATRTFTYDVTKGRLQMVDRMDDGRNRLSTGMIYDSVITNVFSIVEGQPTSARVQCLRQIELSRDDWQTRIETSSVMTSDQDYFHLTNILDAYEGAARIFTKSWTRKIRRELV
jgi:hypothetical protein